MLLIIAYTYFNKYIQNLFSMLFVFYSLSLDFIIVNRDYIYSKSCYDDGIYSRELCVCE